MAKGARGGQAKPVARSGAAAAPQVTRRPVQVAQRAPQRTEYDDDDFEDYEDDDFEEPEREMVAQAPSMPKASRENPTQLAGAIPARKVVAAKPAALEDLDAITHAVKEENAGTKQRAEALGEREVAEAKQQRPSSSSTEASSPRLTRRVTPTLREPPKEDRLEA